MFPFAPFPTSHPFELHLCGSSSGCLIYVHICDLTHHSSCRLDSAGLFPVSFVPHLSIFSLSSLSFSFSLCWNLASLTMSSQLPRDFIYNEIEGQAPSPLSPSYTHARAYTHPQSYISYRPGSRSGSYRSTFAIFLDGARYLWHLLITSGKLTSLDDELLTSTRIVRSNTFHYCYWLTGQVEDRRGNSGYMSARSEVRPALISLLEFNVLTFFLLPESGFRCSPWLHIIMTAR